MVGSGKKIVICATQRCGSTLLCNDLTINELGRPEEYFSHLIKNYATHKDLDLIPQIVKWGTSRNGVFAVKIMANHAPVINRYLAARAGTAAVGGHLGALAEHFAGAYWIWMTRLDLVAQAVSQLMSGVTGVYHAVVDTSSGFVPAKAMLGSSEVYNEHVSISDREISATVEKIVRENESWQEFFRGAGIVPRRVAYEDILNDFSHVRAIGNDLGFDMVEVVTSRNLVKMGNKKSSEIVQSYKAKHRASIND
jgi:LPS sulfotransferase NodH